jgi:cytochrome c5
MRRLRAGLAGPLVLVLVLAACAVALAACAKPPPTPTGTVCPDPDPGTLTWESFGQKFMADYCTMCHSSTLLRAQRHGAPVFHDYDSLRGVLQIPDHIDRIAGAGPAATNTGMPPDECPSRPGGPIDGDCRKPSDAERRDLALWVACEVERAEQAGP